MEGGFQNAMQCGEFEALLCDALDEALSPPLRERFERHAAECAKCGPMLAEAQAGMNWLERLEEVEPPRHLVHNILVATSGAPAEERVPVAAPAGSRVRGWLRPVFAPVLGAVWQPRFGLTFAMAFFSIAVLLDAAGVRLTDLRHADLRPTAIGRNVLHGYYENSARVVRYYDNIRLFQQFEARVRELRQATRPEEEPRRQEQRQQNKNRNDNTSGQPTHPSYSRQVGEDTEAYSDPPQPVDVAPRSPLWASGESAMNFESARRTA